MPRQQQPHENRLVDIEVSPHATMAQARLNETCATEVFKWSRGYGLDDLACVRGQHLHVVTTFEGLRITAVGLTDAALQLLDGFVFLLFQPLLQSAQDCADLPDAILQQR